MRDRRWSGSGYGRRRAGRYGGDAVLHRWSVPGAQQAAENEAAGDAEDSEARPEAVELAMPGGFSLAKEQRAGRGCARFHVFQRCAELFRALKASRWRLSRAFEDRVFEIRRSPGRTGSAAVEVSADARTSIRNRSGHEWQTAREHLE